MTDPVTYELMRYTNYAVSTVKIWFLRGLLLLCDGIIWLLDHLPKPKRRKK